MVKDPLSRANASVPSSQLWSVCLGNLFEHYDTTLFGFLAPFLASIMFPAQEPLIALIFTYTMIPLGMLARPVGSVIFGYIGDRYGRERALFSALVGMAVMSGCIACIPTYQQVGVAAPLLLCVGRVMQNILASGEIMGGGVFLLENSSEKHHDILSSLYGASSVGGILLASAAVSLLYSYDLLACGWRWLYAMGCITALFGCMVQRRADPIQKTPRPMAIGQALRELFEVCTTYRKAFVLIAIAAGFSYANYSIAIVLTQVLIPLISPLTAAQMSELNTILLVLDFCALPFFGWLSLKISREAVMLSTALLVAFGALPLFMLLASGSVWCIVAVRILLVLLGVAFTAPLHSWAQHMVPQAHRYALISIAYATGSQLLGGPTTAISLWAFHCTGTPSSASWYWMGLGFLCSIVLIQATKGYRWVLKTGTKCES